jgi:hypothetical protein
MCSTGRRHLVHERSQLIIMRGFDDFSPGEGIPPGL